MKANHFAVNVLQTPALRPCKARGRLSAGQDYNPVNAHAHRAGHQIMPKVSDRLSSFQTDCGFLKVMSSC